MHSFVLISYRAEPTVTAARWQWREQQARAGAIQVGSARAGTERQTKARAERPRRTALSTTLFTTIITTEPFNMDADLIKLVNKLQDTFANLGKSRTRCAWCFH